MYRFGSSQCNPCDTKLLGEYSAVTEGGQIPEFTPDGGVLQECAGAYSLSCVLFRYIVKPRCRPVNTTALFGASQLLPVTVPRRRSLALGAHHRPLPKANQQQQQHHSNTNPHYIHSITANMADKMEVDAVASEKQVEASGPAPEKPAERSTYTTTATSDCDGLLIDHNSHNRQLRPPRPSRRDLRRPLHSPRAAIHLHHPQVQGLSHRQPQSHPHRFPQRQQPSKESPRGSSSPKFCSSARCRKGAEGDGRRADT